MMAGIGWSTTRQPPRGTAPQPGVAMDAISALPAPPVPR
jgi:hypothetical protein